MGYISWPISISRQGDQLEAVDTKKWMRRANPDLKPWHHSQFLEYRYRGSFLVTTNNIGVVERKAFSISNHHHE